MKKITLVYVLNVVLFACTNSTEFEIYDNKAGKDGRLLWINNIGDIRLVYKYEDIGMSSNLTWLSLEKHISSRDTLYYKLNFKDFSSPFYQIIKDTLYLYDEDKFSGVSGWNEIGYSDGPLVRDNPPLNSSYTVNLKSGLYLLDDKVLKKVSDDANKFRELYDKTIEGIYYIPQPGIGVKFKYSLSSLSRKLSQIKEKENAPAQLF